MKKTKLKDWVRGLMSQASGLTGGAPIRVELRCVRTGEWREDRIGRDFWEDEDFRDGYEAMVDEDGFIIVKIDTACGPKGYGYPESTPAGREPGNVADLASSEFAVD